MTGLEGETVSIDALKQLCHLCFKIHALLNFRSRCRSKICLVTDSHLTPLQAKSSCIEESLSCTKFKSDTVVYHGVKIRISRKFCYTKL